MTNSLSGNGTLSGSGFFRALVEAFTLLATKIIGYATTLTTGGSSYYTTTTGFTGPRFVSAASGSGSNHIVYSADGINWTSSTMPSAQSWRGIVYGDGKFVAIALNTDGYGGPTNQAAYSADGINWTASTMPSAESWLRIVYGNGKFFAFASYSTAAAYSADGINWTASTMPDSYSDMTYGNSTFVAIKSGSDASKAAYSADGINWTEVTVNSTYLSSITYGDGKFLAVGHLGSSAFSGDGITWSVTSSLASISSGRSWSSIAHGNGRFIVNEAHSMEPTSVSAYSTDGINWTQSAMTSSGRWTSTYGDGKFLAVSPNGSSMGGSYAALSSVSTDGINWTTSPMPNGQWFNAAFAQISTSAEVQVLIGDQGTAGSEVVGPVDAYTVPSGQTAIINYITIKNTSSNSITYDLGVLASGITLSDSNATQIDQTLAAGETVIVNINDSYSQPSGTRIVIFPSAVDIVEVKVYGTES